MAALFESNAAPMDADAPAPKPVKEKAIPWVEKYRPKKVTDVASQEETVRTLLAAIEQGALPHLLFYGPPGTGKTSTGLALAQSLYGPTMFKSRILEMNASDERGISVVRDKIKSFASRACGSAGTPGFPNPPFKLIILDEADTMTNDAQAALRRTMETYCKVTRFILICNYVSRIIEPLASRCAKFRFQPLSGGTMVERLRHIAAAEHVALPPDDACAITDAIPGGAAASCGNAVIDKVLEVSHGDMRKAVTTLQSAHHFSGGETLDVSMIVEASGAMPADVTDRLWAALRGGVFDVLQAEVEAVGLLGYPALTVANQIYDDVISDTTIPDTGKAAICEKIAQADKCLADGADDSLQLMDICSTIMLSIPN